MSKGMDGFIKSAQRLSDLADEKPVKQKKSKSSDTMQRLVGREFNKVADFVKWLDNEGLLKENNYSTKEIIECYSNNEELQPLKDLESVEELDDIDLLSADLD